MIMKNYLLIIFFLSIFFSAESQKIKYKDLYYLLDAKNYDSSEPLLKQYLSDPKNAEEGNPNLQMAFILQDKSEKTDILLDADNYINYVDSALIYYKKATQFIDEKEVKKNDEFYQAYQRRDIRTGKFGIKLADVLFDIENRVNALNERKSKIQELQIYYSKTNSNYTKAASLFKKVKDDFPTQKILFLQSSEDLMSRLDRIDETAKLALQNFEAFESTIRKIDKPGYRPALHLTDILDYSKDGESPLLLTNDNVLFWDYSKWVESVKKGIKEVIVPMRTELIEYDQHLNELNELVKKDSMSMTDKIKPLNSVLSMIREYDTDPLPEYIFKYKIGRITNESFKMNHLYYRDSSDISYQVSVAKSKLKALKEMDSLINILLNRNLREDEKNYSNYIKSQYKDVIGLENYVKEQMEEVVYAKKNAEEEVSKLDERARWLVGKQDSIPLFMEVNVGLSKYVPLAVVDKFTTGFYFSGKTPAEGYFALINPSYTQKLKANFKVDNDHFNKQNLDVTKAKYVMEEAGHYYYVLFSVQLPEQEEYAGTLAKIYTSDGLAWVKNIKMSTAPSDLIINPNTDDIIINYDMENYYGGATINTRTVYTKKGEKKE